MDKDTSGNWIKKMQKGIILINGYLPSVINPLELPAPATFLYFHIFTK
jgi:hypothetical protein